MENQNAIKYQKLASNTLSRLVFNYSLVRKIVKFVFVIVLVCNYSNVNAQKNDSTSKYHIAIELDPMPFILSGYSFSLKYSSKKQPKIAIMASIYSSEFPNGMMNKQNKDNQWTDVKIETSFALFGDYFLNSKRKGFYFGPSVFLYHKSAGLKTANNRTDFRSVYPNVRIGYAWYPFKKLGLYINPWLNIGSEIALDNKAIKEGVPFKLNTFNYIVALHIGYSFTF